jgi:hypothetical protein
MPYQAKLALQGVCSSYRHVDVLATKPIRGPIQPGVTGRQPLDPNVQGPRLDADLLLAGLRDRQVLIEPAQRLKAISDGFSGDETRVSSVNDVVTSL